MPKVDTRFEATAEQAQLIYSKRVNQRPTISLCMITLNEAEMLPRALTNVWPVVNEIVIVDGGSTDGTMAIAERFGARVIKRPWPHHFARQRNIGLAAATSEWILVLDADETLEPALLEQLTDWTMEPGSADAFAFARRNLIDGQPDPEQVARGYLDAQIRLFKRRSEIRYHGRVHEALRGYQHLRRELGYSIIHDKTALRQAERHAYYQQLLGPVGRLTRALRIQLACVRERIAASRNLPR